MDKERAKALQVAAWIIAAVLCAIAGTFIVEAMNAPDEPFFGAAGLIIVAIAFGAWALISRRR